MIDINPDGFPAVEYFNNNPRGHRMEKHVKNKFPKFYNFLLTTYPKELSFHERLYWFYHNIKEKPVCIECGKIVKFYNFDKGYFQYCSQECSNHSKYKFDKTKNKIKEKYGVENISQLDEIKKKKEHTLNKHYGVNYLLQSDKYRDDLKQKMIEKYGVEYASQSDEIKIKIRNTNLERYGGVGFESKELMDKTKKTNLERYGVENPYTIPNVVQKRENSSLKKFGTKNPFNSQKFKDWLKQYNIDKYGVEYSIGSKQIRNKIKQTMLSKYGVETLNDIFLFREKAKNTIKEKYGVDSYFSSDEYKNLMSEICDDIVKKRHQTKKKNNTFNTSKIEQDFKKWLDDNNIEYKYQYKSEKYPFNCDFYFPDKDLYLEIQGSWTHGHHPFDSNSYEDIKTLNIWKEKHTDFYNNAINVWTKRDPMKRKFVKENNINWLEIFTCNLDVLISEFMSHYK